MAVCGGDLRHGDLEQLGQLHVSTLPASLISKLGTRFASDFYGYVASSDKEILCYVRGDDGSIVGASVVSLEPQSLEVRLARHSTLLLWAVLRFWRLPLRSVVVDLLGTKQDAACPSLSNRPELVHIFADPELHGKGIGSRLLDSSEAALMARKIPVYWLKTEEDPSNPAHRFYARHGFVERARFPFHGLRFVMLEKRIDATAGDG